MFKFFKSLLTGSILASLAFVLLGIAFIVAPESSMDIICNTIAILLMLYGIYGLVLSFQSISISYSLNIGTSLIALILGIVILCNNAILQVIIPIILGLFFVINGITKLRYAIVLKDQGRSWAGPIVVALVMVACGIVMLARPIFVAATLTTFLGIIMVVYALFDLVDAVMLHKDLSTLEKYFGGKKRGFREGARKEPKEIQEAEVVDKKRKK